MATPTNITRNYLNQIGDQPTTADPLFLTFNADIPEVSRCTADMLSHILYDKTVDCGKKSGLYKKIKIILQKY